MKKTAPDFYLAVKEIGKTVVKKDAPGTFELQLQLAFHKRLLHIFQVDSYDHFLFNILLK